MPEWSKARPGVNDRCKFTRRYVESFRAHFAEWCAMHGVVRLLKDGVAKVRMDGFPGELYEIRLVDLVREDHEVEDPIDETVAHVTEVTTWTVDQE